MKILCCFFFLLQFCQAAPVKSDLPIPRFACLRSNKVNMHVGPGVKYPVEWTFVCKSMPLMITAEFEQWRRVKAIDGTVGWIHKSMLSSKKNKILEQDTAMYTRASKNSKKIANLSKWVVVDVLKSSKSWSKVSTKTDDGLKIIGWVKNNSFWSLDSN